MNALRSCFVGCLLGAGMLAGPVRGESAPDPLRLVPVQADVVLHVPQPRQAVDAVVTFDWLRRWTQFDSVVEFLDSTNARRAQQLIAYFEKQLGMPWRDALDRLAGGGIVTAAKFGADPAPALLIVQGTDAAVVQRFVKLGRQVVEQELARVDAKARLRDGKYRGLATVSIGKDFHAAVVGATLLISNNGTALQKALDLHLDGPAQSLAVSGQMEAARRLLPPKPLASVWLNLGPAQRAREGKEIFELPNNQPIIPVFLGGWINVAARSPFICAGLYRDDAGFALAVRMPSGRDGMPAVMTAHAPPLGGPGALPLLEPRGTLFSTSFYLDAYKFWEHRKELLSAQNLKGLEEFDKTSARFLLGRRFSDLLKWIGERQRYVAANQYDTGYKLPSNQRIPSFAGVFEMREPEALSSALNGILRAAALLLNFQTKLKLVEEKRGDVQIVGYRFADDGKLSGDNEYLRFAYSPCFATVGNQFIASSTLELCRELVDLIEKERAGLPQVKQQMDEAKAKLTQAESQLQLTIAKLSTAADVDERSQLIARVQQLENERIAQEKRLTALGRAATGPALPVAVRTQAYAQGNAESLAQNEDQLLAQTILTQALPPEAARKQVKMLIDQIRQAGIVRTETEYRANEFRFDARLMLPKMEKAQK